LLQNRRERDHDVRGVKGVRGSVAEHPEIGYFIYNVGEKRNIEESDIPDAVAQAFLGKRIGCARCHNHPLEKYTQDDFYHFAAFFSKVQLKRIESEKGGTTLNVGTREEEEQRKRLSEAEKSFAEATNALLRAAGAEMDQARKRLAEQQKKVAEARLQLQKAALKMPTVTQPRTKKPMVPRPLDRQTVTFEPGQDPRERLPPLQWRDGESHLEALFGRGSGGTSGRLARQQSPQQPGVVEAPQCGVRFARLRSSAPASSRCLVVLYPVPAKASM
jgi:hypothetical protein